MNEEKGSERSMENAENSMRKEQEEKRGAYFSAADAKEQYKEG